MHGANNPSLRETIIPSPPSRAIDSNLRFNLPFTLGAYRTMGTKYGSVCIKETLGSRLPPWQAKQKRLEADVTFVCLEIMRSRNKQQPAPGNTKFTREAIHIAETMSVQKIYSFSISGKEGSQLTQEVLVQLDERRLEKFCRLYAENLDELLENDYACYVLKTAVSRCKSLLSATLETAQRRYFKMVVSPGGSRVLMALSDLSERFRSFGLSFFENHFIKLVPSLDAMILLTQLIVKTPRPQDISFVIDYLEKDRSLIDQPLVRRILGSFLEKCLLKDAKFMFLILRPHLGWLIADRYGNFIVRVLLERNVENMVRDCIKVCLQSYKTIFRSCYSRFTILWLLKMKSAAFAQAWISKLIVRDSGLEEMFAKNINTNLLLLALSRVSDPKLLIMFQSAYDKLKSRNLQRNPRYAKHLNQFDRAFTDLMS